MPKPGELDRRQTQIGQNRPPMPHADAQPKDHIGRYGGDLLGKVLQVLRAMAPFEDPHIVEMGADMRICLGLLGHQHQPKPLAQLA